MKLVAVVLIGIVLLNLWYQSQLRVKITKITTKEQLAETNSILNILDLPIVTNSLDFYPTPKAETPNSTLEATQKKSSLKEEADFKSTTLKEVADIVLNQATLKAKLKKVNLISFWATWCPTCKTEFPEIKDLQDKWQKNDFQVLSINCDTEDMKTEALNMFKSFNLNFPLFFADEQEASNQFQLEVLPSHLLVNEDGEILLRFEGATQWTSKKIQTLIEEHLK